MAETILVTGGCGFIGTNFVRHMLERHDYNIVNLDKLTYAGNLENLEDIASDGKYTFVRGDIASMGDVEAVFERSIDIVVNFAAESHVDRSIMDPDAFIRTNVNGTFNLLELARKKGVGRFVQISTDEVYGSLGDSGAFREDTPLSPNSPYSASKTAADILAMAYFKTYGMPVVITRCSNNYGPYQFPEKLIPLIITNALADKDLPVYGDGLNVRDWIHVKDHCAAIDLVVHKGEEGNVYNIGASNERTNIGIVELVLDILGKPRSLIRYVKDRPGHDRRYAIDSGKITERLGYRPSVDFSEGMRGTVEWYVNNRGWWERIKTGAYLDYYEKMYGNR
ncbi:MAG: dTDP-glucose 4,6-dehydratase [Syntrophorhabdus sp.]|nr:dTDP-glucose 4,6-dehydratase [Syntrophorhabdus sp.]